MEKTKERGNLGIDGAWRKCPQQENVLIENLLIAN
jgi:hypothetical protein